MQSFSLNYLCVYIYFVLSAASRTSSALAVLTHGEMTCSILPLKYHNESAAGERSSWSRQECQSLSMGPGTCDCDCIDFHLIAQQPVPLTNKQKQANIMGQQRPVLLLLLLLVPSAANGYQICHRNVNCFARRSLINLRHSSTHCGSLL